MPLSEEVFLYPEPNRSPAILIVGIGALGCPAAELVARARIARLTLVDSDQVESSNLQRQVLFSDADVGRYKVDAAAERLGSLGADIETLRLRLDPSNADTLVAAHDFTIDATDDPTTKLLINVAAVSASRPFCYGGVVKTGGLAMSVWPGRSACLSCVFPSTRVTDTERAAGCDQAGILAPVAGVIGALQARSALGACGIGPATRFGRMAVYEVRGRRWRFIDFPVDDRCPVCAGESADLRARRIESCRS